MKTGFNSNLFYEGTKNKYLVGNFWIDGVLTCYFRISLQSIYEKVHARQSPKQIINPHSSNQSTETANMKFPRERPSASLSMLMLRPHQSPPSYASPSYASPRTDKTTNATNETEARYLLAEILRQATDLLDEIEQDRSAADP